MQLSAQSRAVHQKGLPKPDENQAHFRWYQDAVLGQGRHNRIQQTH